MNAPRRLIRVLSIALVTLLALALRLRAVERLPIDYDEDDYLRAGQQYAAAIQSGDLSGFTRDNYRTEHPPLIKIAYGVALSPLPQVHEIPDRPTTAEPANDLPEPHLTVARLAGVLFATLQVLALAILNPLAGFFLALHTWTIKYTSQVMLESLPSLTSALAIVCYLKSGRESKRWLVLSALALGLTAASKYVYCIIGLVIAVDWLGRTFPSESPRSAARIVAWLRPVAIWGITSIVVFFFADPYLWPDPLHRLTDSVFYHFGYAANSPEVKRAAFPMWQPLVWLAQSVPWHPNVFPFGVDLYISIFALLGVRRLWAQSRVVALWLNVALGFLLYWTTKWPQYILILTFPLSLAAAEGLRGTVWEPAVAAWQRRAARSEVERRAEARIRWRETRQALPWLIPGLVVLSLIVVYPLVYQGAMSLTDFSSIAIRDGINGGVWRAVGQGLTGQVKPAEFDPFQFNLGTAPTTVSYAGPGLLLSLFSGGLGNILVFEAVWTVLAVGLQTALGLAVALALHQHGVRLAGGWRALFILPWAIPEFVGALVWSRIFEPTTGSLSVICGCPLEWMRSADQTMLVLLIGATWMGWPLIMLAATAGLKMIPRDVYDVAAIDGAGRFMQLRYITAPLLLPLLAPAIIIRGISAFNQFYLFVVMQTEFPHLTLATLSYYLFSGFGGGLYAVSAAINVFAVAMLIIFILMFNRGTRGGAAEGVTYA